MHLVIRDHPQIESNGFRSALEQCEADAIRPAALLCERSITASNEKALGADSSRRKRVKKEIKSLVSTYRPKVQKDDAVERKPKVSPGFVSIRRIRIREVISKWCYNTSLCGTD